MSGGEIPQWAEEILKRLDMVVWDRFTTSEDPTVGEVIDVYGWIGRQRDEYKDFVNVRFFTEHPEADEGLVAYTTSSDEWTGEIHRLIYGEVDGHNDCKRVEGHTTLDNVVELGEQATLPDGDEP